METTSHTISPPEAPPLAPRADAPRAPAGRQRRPAGVSNRIRRDGKFFRLGDRKFYVRGVTYGPFALSSENVPLPERDQVRRDFQQIRELGANCIRIYHLPPDWFLDLAQEMGLWIFLDVAWPKNLSFIGDSELTQMAHDAVREAAARCGNHPATFAISVANEIPPDLVRYHGPRAIERFIDALVRTAKAEAPQCLVTFASFPTTEYLQPRLIDFACFNVYLHDAQVFGNYLARLQGIAGDKPLLLGEYGVDTAQEHDEQTQATMLAEHVRTAFDEGCCGMFVFSYTDDWVVNGYRIEDWRFGLVRRETDERGYRRPKPAFAALQPVFARVPQLIDEPLPKCSVIICSYNGAGTLESCLRSMRRLDYRWGYEVIVVDDGSTDATQQILQRFPEVRNIRQPNRGLAYARNVGMEAAMGEILVYTDSDCEVDEDWLYYIALAMKRSSHVGMGGPNLIPDEGSWVAECVGMSPGGPAHVMINDREAEHVPGCNLAVYKWAAQEINGFDPQFRKAGDDVDFIWRLQQRGYTIGFAPAAQVWHYRRNTVRAYLSQQRGYGEAEALLKFKHPDRFNALGGSHWRGRIYGPEQGGVRVGQDVIYHGTFGTGLFQTIYRRPASLVAAMLMSIEWHLLAGFVAVLGLAFWPLVWVALCMFATPAVLAVIAALQAPPPRHRHWLTRPLVAYLHFRQPIVRGWARHSVRLKTRILKGASGYQRPAELPVDPRRRRELCYWHDVQDRLVLLRQILADARAAEWRMRVDSGWSRWDVEIYASRYTKVRIVTASENHDGRGRLTRVRVEPSMSRFAVVLNVAGLILAGLLLLHLWPFSRPAVLLPLVGWTMYLVDRWKVTAPVLGLIHEAAIKAGFTPVYAGAVAPADAKPADAAPAGEPQVSADRVADAPTAI